MPRIERFEIEIRTGSCGTAHTPKFSFNGHVLAFEGPEGGTNAGDTFRGRFEPRSFAHEVLLQGPDSGDWDVERIRVRYFVTGGEDYSVCFGEIRLDQTNALDIWRPPPLPSFDV